ncbi:hypothetical protein BLNAU_20377 [Blattamonas nauphoetae]|uniref:Uncharacterized protein n=1 Tax=Blattamonas nauphoetae TaxID=2049346 RepID=A0ABQ9WYV0_9EUKA|nr:hypothetical protein BLNAU_20377 [Blattamonas nauphoetae]
MHMSGTWIVDGENTATDIATFERQITDIQTKTESMRHILTKDDRTISAKSTMIVDALRKSSIKQFYLSSLATKNSTEETNLANVRFRVQKAWNNCTNLHTKLDSLRSECHARQAYLARKQIEWKEKLRESQAVRCNFQMWQQNDGNTQKRIRLSESLRVAHTLRLPQVPKIDYSQQDINDSLEKRKTIINNLTTNQQLKQRLETLSTLLHMSTEDHLSFLVACKNISIAHSTPSTPQTLPSLLSSLTVAIAQATQLAQTERNILSARLFKCQERVAFVESTQRRLRDKRAFIQKEWMERTMGTHLQPQ